MSFTAEVKDELSRVDGRNDAERRAELAALTRIDGTLAFSGGGGMRLSVDTEVASVARLLIKLMHRLYPNVTTELSVRRSVLRRTFNFLISIPQQPGLDGFLCDMGITTGRGGLQLGIEPGLVEMTRGAAGYLRGAFLASGFIADPWGDSHFELTVEGAQLSDDLVALMRAHRIPARSVVRRNNHIVYLKGGEQIIAFLSFTGARRSVLQMEDARVMKSVRNEVNRQVNAELANQHKSSNAAGTQIQAISRLIDARGIDSIPPALQEIARLRLAHPDASLRELGELSSPPLSKSAVYHRVRRIEELARGL